MNIGAVFEVDSRATIRNTQITGNNVTVKSLSGDASDEGATFTVYRSDSVLLQDSLVAGNTAFVSAVGASATLDGAGIWNAGTLRVLNTKVVGNSGRANGSTGSARGGGVWNGTFSPGDTPPVLTLSNSFVGGNAISGSPGITLQGGGLFTAFPVTLTNSLIKNNAPDQCFGC